MRKDSNILIKIAPEDGEVKVWGGSRGWLAGCVAIFAYNYAGLKNAKRAIRRDADRLGALSPLNGAQSVPLIEFWRRVDAGEYQEIDRRFYDYASLEVTA